MMQEKSPATTGQLTDQKENFMPIKAYSTHCLSRRAKKINSLISTRNLAEAKNKVMELRYRFGNTMAVQRAASTIERMERVGK
jgi:hypothetical protein